MKYYDGWNKLKSFDCPMMGVIANRGVGKSWGAIIDCFYRALKSKEVIVYLVQNTPQYDATIADNCVGLTDFVNLVELSEVEDEYQRIQLDYLKKQFAGKELKFKDGYLRLDGQQLMFVGALVMDDILRRIKYKPVCDVILDEFLPKKMYKAQQKMPSQFVDIVQSIVRLRKVNIWLFGNALYLHNSYSILNVMGVQITNFGIYKIYRKNGTLYGVIDYVDSSRYPEYAKALDESVAGGLAEVMGKTELNDNTITTNNLVVGTIKKTEYKGTAQFAYGKGVLVLMELRPHMKSSGKCKYAIVAKQDGSFLGGYNNMVNIDALDTSTKLPYISPKLFMRMRQLFLDKALVFDTHNTYSLFEQRFIMEQHVNKG